MIEITNNDKFRFESKIYKTETCWLWEGSKTEKGYGHFRYKTGIIRAHRFAYILYKNIDPKEMEVCHTCDIPACCNPDHLFLGTHRDNQIDSMNKGRHNFVHSSGENNNFSKLTNEQVLKIRYMGTLGYTQKEIGNAFGVTNATISLIIKRKVWTHI